MESNNLFITCQHMRHYTTDNIVHQFVQNNGWQYNSTNNPCKSHHDPTLLNWPDTCAAPVFVQIGDNGVNSSSVDVHFMPGGFDLRLASSLPLGPAFDILTLVNHMAWTKNKQTSSSTNSWTGLTAILCIHYLWGTSTPKHLWEIL